MYARRLNEEDDAEQVPGECELKVLTVTHSSTTTAVAPEDFSFVFGSWSIGNSENFDEGEACGKVDDRTTSLAGFEQALERRDGNGFGNPMISQVTFKSVGGIVDTEISSSTVTATSVTSLSGAPNDPMPATMGYGLTFYTSHVNFRDGDGSQFSLPLLFHDSAGCLGEDVDLDVYSSAVLEYGNFLGGNVTSEMLSDDSDEAPVLRDRFNVILLSPDALNEYLITQLYCDVASAPVWTEAGYAMCSDVAEFVLAPDGGTENPPPMPNVTTSVNGCPISVLPARFMAVGDFVTGTFESRSSEWLDHVFPVQIAISSQSIDATASLLTATGLVIQSTTQVGFALPEANNSTEWVLVLVVAVEALFVIISALAVLAFSSLKGVVRRGPTPRREWVKIIGTALALGALLVLGLYPVFVGWDSEQEAEDMAHNDVYVHIAETTVCGAASWEGDTTSFGQWCTTLRTASVSLLVRSYESTFEGRYADLAIASAVIGGVSWVAFFVTKTFFVEKPAVETTSAFSPELN